MKRRNKLTAIRRIISVMALPWMRSVLVLLLVVIATNSCWATTTFDAAAAFEQGWTTHSNPNGVWSYGYSSGFTSPITLYNQTVQNGVNGPNAQYWLSPSVDIGTSPAAEFNNGPAFNDGNVNFLANEFLLVAGIGGQFSNLVFTAPADGVYSIACSFRGAQNGIGTVVAVVANGNILFSSSVTAVGQIVPCDTEVTLTAGSTVVFSVGPGGGSQNTGLSVTITTPPAAAGFVYVANCGSICGSTFVTAGNVSAYSIDGSTGALTSVPGSPFPGVFMPFWVAVDPTTRFAYVADSGGVVSAYSINGTSGALTPVPGSPFLAPPGTATRSVAVDPTGRFAYAANQSFSGSVSVYSINGTTGALTPVPGSPFPAGAEAFSVAVDPMGRFAYVANVGDPGIGVPATISGYTINGATGALTPVPGSPFPADSPDSMTVNPTGRFAYVVNNASSTISAYSIDGTTGALTPVPGSPFPAGAFPRSVTVGPSGKFAYSANQIGNVSAFTIDSATGALTPVPGSPFAAGSQPVSVTLDSAGRFAYVANASSDNVSAYAINGATGALTPVPGSPFPAGTFPVSVATTMPAAPVLKITPPPSVRLDALESNQSAFFFAERVSFVLPSPVSVDATSPGTYNSVGSLTPGNIPAGTVVDSYFLHADPFDPNNGVFYSGTVSFSNPILGVIALSASLDQTDPILGAPGTLYPAPGSEPARGFELGAPDMFVISPDGKTLTFSNAASGADDQLRIVTAASPPQPVAPGTSTTFTSPNVINQTVTIPPDANMNGTATMRVSFIQVSPAVFNASIANGTNGNDFSGGTPVPAGTTCTPINGAGGNCIITENKCFRADGTAFDLCPITATTTPIQLTSQYETSSPQPNPAFMIASDGQSNYAVITTGFNGADLTISGGTKALNSDEVIGNLPGSPPTDTVPPTTTAVSSPVAPNGANGWFTTSPVSVILAATDDTLVKQITYSATGAQPIAPTTVLGASTFFPIANQGVTTISYQATDQAGNVEALKMLTVKIDTTPPTISTSSPTNGAAYILNQGVTAGYTCTDPIANGVNLVSGLASCTGPVGNGSNIDTASVGNKTFTVNSTDNAGNLATQSVSYSVSYKVCILYDPTRAVMSGAVIPLKMYLCDASGKDVSNSGVTVHAFKLIRVSTPASEPIATAGGANPGNNFRFDSTLGPSGGYVFNLLANLPTGTYELLFTAGNDPSTTHFLTFQVN